MDGVSVVQDLYDIRSQNKQILQVILFCVGGGDFLELGGFGPCCTADRHRRRICGAEGLDAVSVPEPEKKPSSSAAAPKRTRGPVAGEELLLL